MRWASTTFSIEQSDARIPLKQSTFSTGCADRIARSKKLGSKRDFFDRVRIHDLVFDRKSPFSIHRSDFIRNGLTCLCKISKKQNHGIRLVFAESHHTCVALPTHKTKNAGRIMSNIVETGIWSKSAPQIPFWSFNTSAVFAGGVLPTKASRGHTTPGRTQPSHDIVSYVVGLALVLLELEKSGATLPCDCILAPPLRELQHSRSQIRQFLRQKSRW